jgi:hypothetical protein
MAFANETDVLPPIAVPSGKLPPTAALPLGIPTNKIATKSQPLRLQLPSCRCVINQTNLN